MLYHVNDGTLDLVPGRWRSRVTARRRDPQLILGEVTTVGGAACGANDSTVGFV
jgi:hypothetical protein